MLSYCLKCRTNTECKNPSVIKTKNGKIMLLLKRTVCDNKKPRFITKQASGFLISFRIKNTLK